MRSLFRPAAGGTPRASLDDHRSLVRSIERRGFLRGGLSLGALTLLSGCDVHTPDSILAGLMKVSEFNDKFQALVFDPNNALAPTYPESMVLKPPKFNAYYDITEVRVLDAKTWKLELAGLIDDKRPWTAEQFATLPEKEEIIRHICVEGWDYIGQWSGVPLRTFLERIGADLKAKYVNFTTADDYPSTLDMATALHPQTLLATKYARQTLDAPFGYPLRLRTAFKLGFKNPKWITAIEVTNTYRPGYWEKLGYNWFAGL